MKMQGMAKPEDPVDKIVRDNLLRFREEAEMSQADAAELAGVSVDNLRRYENGVTAKISGAVLSVLAKAYGHSVDDFFLAEPPPAKLEDRAVFYLRTRPGVEIDPKLYRELQDVIERANRDVRKKPKKQSGS